MERLPRAFFERPTLEVARDLLGRRLVRWIRGQRISGRIVEVEAYIGEDDQASHAAVGRTARNAVMYGPPGHAYIYMIYGQHYCLNIVTEPEGFPAAILIRALEPEEGLSWIARRRRGRPMRDWLRGPGRVCAGLAIDRSFNGHDLCAPDAQLWVEAGTPVPDDLVATSPRIRVRGDPIARSRPWRFYIRGNPFVSDGGDRMPRRAWWVVAGASAGDWHWRDFFRNPAEEGRNWGGWEWIRSPVSWARIREMRKGDVVVAYQAGEGVLGLAVLASEGYPEVEGGPYNTFDLAPAPTLWLREPIPLFLIRQIPRARALFEFLRAPHGTVFRIAPEGFEALLRLIRTLNPDQSGELEAFLEAAEGIR